MRHIRSYCYTPRTTTQRNHEQFYRRNGRGLAGQSRASPQYVCPVAAAFEPHDTLTKFGAQSTHAWQPNTTIKATMTSANWRRRTRTITRSSRISPKLAIRQGFRRLWRHHSDFLYWGGGRYRLPSNLRLGVHYVCARRLGIGGSKLGHGGSTTTVEAIAAKAWRVCILSLRCAHDSLRGNGWTATISSGRCGSKNLWL